MSPDESDLDPDVTPSGRNAEQQIEYLKGQLDAARQLQFDRGLSDSQERRIRTDHQRQRRDERIWWAAAVIFSFAIGAFWGRSSEMDKQSTAEV